MDSIAERRESKALIISYFKKLIKENNSYSYLSKLWLGDTELKILASKAISKVIIVTKSIWWTIIKATYE